MKKKSTPFFVSILILICFAFMQCKKNTQQQAASVIGTWAWIYTYKDIPVSPTNPATPQNTGIQEILIFKNDNTFKHIKNNTSIDSGTYLIGHGTYKNSSSYVYSYDSISYFHNGLPIIGGIDYYQITGNDTLKINNDFAGFFGGSCYTTLPDWGVKTWLKQ